MTNDDRMGGGTPLERYLEGELDLRELPAEVRHDEARLAELLATHARSDARAPAGLRSDVMREIAGLEMDEERTRQANRRQGLLAWVTRPRTLRYTPVSAGAALAAAALVAFLIIPGGDAPEGTVSGPASIAPSAITTTAVPTAAPGARPATNGTGAVVTRFVFVAPDAESVTLAGDWIGWDTESIPLRQLRSTGVWTVDVLVPPGLHEYAFVVDGTEWRPDPLAGSQTDDGFGRTNSVLLVSGAEA